MKMIRTSRVLLLAAALGACGGTPTVAIPYFELKDHLNPASPLEDFWNLTKR